MTSTPERPQVELRIPADSAYVSVLRTTAAGLAARADFPVDAMEDLRIAVGEASALLLPLAPEGADLRTTFEMEPGCIDVAMTVTPAPVTSVDTSSFAWQVLTTLTDRTAVHVDEGSLRIDLTVSSGFEA